MRDPETERYELRAQVEANEELGRALYERRRPDAPKTWLELSEADRAEWILIAVDQEQARLATSGTTATVAAQVQAAGLAARAEPVDSRVPDLAEKLRRTWMSGKPIRIDADGSHIDWAQFAHALVHDEGVHP